jgi:hypothetical protein
MHVDRKLFVDAAGARLFQRVEQDRMKFWYLHSKIYKLHGNLKNFGLLRMYSFNNRENIRVTTQETEQIPSGAILSGKHLHKLRQ